ncbi:hypothetical protein GCM10009096_09340 [Parasphingorhabdus litoris]|uniref:Uncharacterized protein n=1 Tax=Parasphingorhabdus litoris TaxID=394733 RepID=A0ABN1A906_9SPHN|nr:hypothetical protein [Parasphingorhabdus litoris]
MIFLAIIIMVLFVPIAVGLALFIIVPDWFQENRNSVIIGIGIADFLLFAAIVLLLFGV